MLAGNVPRAPVTDLGVLSVSGTFSAPAFQPDEADLLANGSYWSGLLAQSNGTTASTTAWGQGACNLYMQGGRRTNMTCAGLHLWMGAGSPGSPLLLGGGVGPLAGIYSSQKAWTCAAGGFAVDEPVLAYTRIAPALPWVRSALPAGTVWPKGGPAPPAACA